MMKKMCPVCDLPLGTGNYCPRCRKVVRKPYMQNVDYYLNERHPVNERDCGFHNPYLEADHHGENGNSVKPVLGVPQRAGTSMGNQKPGQISRPGQAGYPGGRPAGTAAPGPSAGASSRTASGNNSRPSAGASPRPIGTVPARPAVGNGNPGGQKKNAGRSLLIAVCISLVVIVMVAIGNIGGLFYESETAGNTVEYGYDYESRITELTEEEVMEAGGQCMGYYHFPADGIYVSEQLLEAVGKSDSGYSLDSDEFNTDNYLYEDTSYYGSIRSLYLLDTADHETADDYIDQYLDINYDTATKELHDYTSRLYSREGSLAFLECFLTATEESSGIAAEDRKTDEIMEEARDIVNEGQSSYIYEGLFAIEIYKYEGEDALYIYVSYNDPADSVGAEL